MQVSQAVTVDYPDLQLTNGLEVIAGLLYVPLSVGGRDFIAFLRKGQPRQVKWAGRPYKQGEPKHSLEPRTSFKLWSETVAGRCLAWADEHLETAGVLALVYGKVCRWRYYTGVRKINVVGSLSKCGDKRRLRFKLRSSRTSCYLMLVMKVCFVTLAFGRMLTSSS